MVKSMDMSHYIKPISDRVLDDGFPWYYENGSTSSRFPFMSHSVVPRYDLNKPNFFVTSDLFEPIVNLIDLFCKFQHINFKKVLRINFNMMFSFSEKHTDPHVDYDIKHKVIILYFSDSNGDTLVFDQKFDPIRDRGGILNQNERNKLIIKERIQPKFGKMVCFDGLYHHANEFCDPSDRRIVLVACIQ